MSMVEIFQLKIVHFEFTTGLVLPVTFTTYTTLEGYYDRIHDTRYLPVYWSIIRSLGDEETRWMMEGNFDM